MIYWKLNKDYGDYYSDVLERYLKYESGKDLDFDFINHLVIRNGNEWLEVLECSDYKVGSGL